MPHRHRSHTANPNRRTRPIGPVHGLAVTHPLPQVPFWEEPKYEPAPGYGEGERRVFTLVHWHPMSMHAQVVAVNGGNIGIKQVDRKLKLTPRQRETARYSTFGELQWPGNPPLEKPEHWQDMLNGNGEHTEAQHDGARLLVVRLLLHRDESGISSPNYVPKALAWDVADPTHHLVGMTTRPADDLMVSARTLDSLLPSLPVVQPVAIPTDY